MNQDHKSSNNILSDVLCEDNELPSKRLKLASDQNNHSLNSDSVDTKEVLQERTKENGTLENKVQSVKVHLMQTEQDVGISEYLSFHEGFSGILKHRYSDFMVNEIQDGTVVCLSSFSLPKEDVKSISLTEEIGEELSEEIQELCSDDNKKEFVLIDVTKMDKEKRRNIHIAIRQNCIGLNSNTEDREDKKFIVVSKSKKGAKGRKIRQVWPHCRGNYTHFVLYKENTDTMEAVNVISNLLRMPSSAFTYAGTKDKRAKTSQMMSVYRVPAEKLLALNSKLKTIKIGNIEYKNSPIKLGDLSGNYFTLVLREISGSPEKVSDAIRSFTNAGFINYYGMQRFGTTGVPTHEIGKALLDARWQDAIDLILKPRIGEYCSMTACRELWFKTRDAKKTYELLHKKGSIEGHLLRGLIAHGPTDLVNSLNTIPRNTRLMYIHSFQSYIWNQVVSYRIAKYGLKPILGDFILVNAEEDTDISSSKERVDKVTTDNIDSVSIYDVVLPLPGYSVDYPENEIGDVYRDLLKKNGLSFDSFVSRVKSYSAGGAYRHLVVLPKSVKWSLMKYKDSIQPLLLSDWDKLQGTTALEPEDGDLTALKVEFCLPTSSYATMAVREIMKLKTTVWSQKLEVE